jgi:hypothetical protein
MSSPIKVPLTGQNILLDKIISTVSTAYFRLFQAPTSALPDDFVISDFTEATFYGYATIPIYSWQWSPSATNANDEAEKTAPDITFACTYAGTPEDIHGYYVTDDYGYVLWAAKFPVAVTIDDVDQSITIPPLFTLKSAY